MPRTNTITAKGRALLETLQDAKKELEDPSFTDHLSQESHVVKVLRRVIDLQLDALEQLIMNDEPCWSLADSDD